MRGRSSPPPPTPPCSSACGSFAPQEAAAAAGAAACESAEVSRRLPSAGRGIRHQSSVPGTTNPPRALLEPCPGLSPFPAYGAQPREAIPDPRAEMMSCGLLTSSKEPGTGAVRGRGGRGQSSFLLQQEVAGGDVFSCSLGNLPPGRRRC
ncbi:unnamed protein product [Lepidochelys olivacea]